MTNKTIKLFKNDLPESLIISGDIAIDTETMGLNHNRDRLCLIQIADQNGNIYLIQIEKDIKYAPFLASLLSNKNTQKIFHFARFDVAVIYKYLNIRVENIFCTKIASKLVRTYTDSHSLKELCREFFSINLSKQQQSSDWGLANLSKEQEVYAANDVLYLHKIRDKLMELLVRENRLLLANSCFDFIFSRALLDLHGWNDIDIFAHA
jgi:ribonuclease D